ncbi:MAG: hypothetical protein ACSLE8_07865 [Rhodococcus sp. (in: high G+C Gram-positive bacteria)]
MGTRADTLKKQTTQHARIVEEAHAALMDAEDALTAHEDRESRRSSRSRRAAPRGRVEV